VHVIVATDGTDTAIEAARRALDLLRADAEITLVSVILDWEDPNADAGGIEGPVETPEEADRDYAGSALVDYVEEHRADLLVIGAGDKGPLKRLFGGSVSDHVVHKAPCPVLVVRHQTGH
jgi:nucleotide-binding universal stress UspA family protein